MLRTRLRRSNWNPNEKQNRKKTNKVPPNSKKLVTLVNDGICLKYRGKLKYYFCVFLVFKVSFDLKYYNSYFDARIKTYNSLNF